MDVVEDVDAVVVIVTPMTVTTATTIIIMTTATTVDVTVDAIKFHQSIAAMCLIWYIFRTINKAYLSMLHLSLTLLMNYLLILVWSCMDAMKITLCIGLLWVRNLTLNTAKIVCVVLHVGCI